MIPAAFDYVRAGSAEEAIALLGQHGDDAKLLAGGHSLLPLMKLRLAAPAVLIDVGRLRDLSYVRDAGDHIAVGALTRHHDVETSDVLKASVPLLAHAAGQVGDPQVRHRGTIGGSVAHGDPASDLPAVLLAADATLVARGSGEERTIAANDFFVGFLETALAPDELLTEIRFPKTTGGWSFQKFNRRAQDWAIVGVAASAGPTALGSRWSTWPPRPFERPRSRARWRPVRRRARPRLWRRRASIRRPTPTRRSSSAGTWRRCWSVAHSKRWAAKPVRWSGGQAGVRRGCQRRAGRARVLGRRGPGDSDLSRPHAAAPAPARRRGGGGQN